MTGEALAAIAGGTAFLGVVGVLVATVARRPGTTEPAAQPAPGGPVPTGYRWCPAERRNRVAVLHTDRSATCETCGNHIPAGGDQ